MLLWSKGLICSGHDGRHCYCLFFPVIALSVSLGLTAVLIIILIVGHCLRVIGIKRLQLPLAYVSLTSLTFAPTSTPLATTSTSTPMSRFLSDSTYPYRTPWLLNTLISFLTDTPPACAPLPHTLSKTFNGSNLTWCYNAFSVAHAALKHFIADALIFMCCLVNRFFFFFFAKYNEHCSEKLFFIK